MRQYSDASFPDQDERIFPVVPFLTGLVVAPFLYGALNPGYGYGGYYPYPPPPPYYPYGGYGYGGYGYGHDYGYNYDHKPNYHKGYY